MTVWRIGYFLPIGVRGGTLKGEYWYETRFIKYVKMCCTKDIKCMLNEKHS